MSLSVAFGRRGVEKLVGELQTAGSGVLPNATLSSLRLLLGELSTQELKAAAIGCGAVSACAALLTSPSPPVVAAAATALSRLVLLSQGRDALASCAAVPTLARLAGHDDLEVRVGATSALSSLTLFREGWTLFTSCADAVALTGDALAVHPLAVCVLANATAFYSAGSAAVVSDGVVPRLVELLRACADEPVLAQATLTLRHLAMHECGKDAAIESGAVPELLALVRHPCVSVRCNACGALALLSISLPAKLGLLGCGSAPLASLLLACGDAHADTAANAAAAVDCFKELPALRDAFGALQAQ